MIKIICALVIAGSAVMVMPGARAAVDAEAAKALFTDNGCNKCHKPAKPAKGPSLQKIAKDNAGKAGAVDMLIKHITTGPKVKFDDGTEEDHKIIDTTDKAKQKNLVEWILSTQ
jgi:cytochrome c